MISKLQCVSAHKNVRFFGCFLLWIEIHWNRDFYLRINFVENPDKTRQINKFRFFKTFNGILRFFGECL